MRIRIETLPNEVVFQVCERFLVDGWKAQSIADDVSQATNSSVQLTREQVYPVVREGMRRGFLLMCPPQETVLQQRIADRFQLTEQEQGRVCVVHSSGPGAIEHVANATADRAIDLIRELGRTKSRVHLGLGAGYTTMLIARRMGQRLRSEVELPNLVVHALSSGFMIEKPFTSPVAFFTYFDQAIVDVEYVGLFSGPVVDAESYGNVQEFPGVRTAFERREEIDIVITSFGTAHGSLLEQLISQSSPLEADYLRGLGWVGDVQYRPYSSTGPIETTSGSRAVTVFDLRHYVELARQPNKHVILVAGPKTPSAQSSEPNAGDIHTGDEQRSEALLPLLSERPLRVWNHLVIDAGTARSAITLATRRAV